MSPTRGPIKRHRARFANTNSQDRTLHAMPLFELLANTTNTRAAQTNGSANAQRSASAGELRTQRSGVPLQALRTKTGIN